MTRARRRWLVVAIAFGVLPIALYEALVDWLSARGASGVMLGAVADASLGSLVATGAALLLRVYTMVALPGLLTLVLVTGAARALYRSG